MSKKEVIHSEKKRVYYTRYTDGVLAGGFLFVSGQASIDYKTYTFILDTIEERHAVD